MSNLIIPCKLNGAAKTPKRAYDTDAGFDLSCREAFTLPSNQIVKVNTGVCVALPPNTFGWVAPRSGLGARGVVVLGGIIDSGYRGEIQVILGLIDSQVREITFMPGSRIAQLIIMPGMFYSVSQIKPSAVALTPQLDHQITFMECDELPAADRSACGLGSTGL